MVTPTTGLSRAEVAARLATDGPNRLPPPERQPAWRRLVGEMVHFFALMLWVAGVLAFVAGLPQLGVAIFVVVVINGVFAFVQEERAERAAERLGDLMPVRVTVRREGKVEVIDAADLVVGDVVLLAPGDRVAADLEVVESHDLRIDESMLTGESRPRRRQEADAAFAGTFVVDGRGCRAGRGHRARHPAGGDRGPDRRGAAGHRARWPVSWPGWCASSPSWPSGWA